MVEWWVAVLGAIGTLLVGVAPWILKLLQGRTEAIRQMRRDTAEEWQTLARELRESQSFQTHNMEVMRADFTRRLDELQIEHKACLEDRAQLKERSARLTEYLEKCRLDVERLTARLERHEQATGGSP